MLIELAEGYTASATTLKKKLKLVIENIRLLLPIKIWIRNWSMKLMPKWWPKHQLLLQQSTEWLFVDIDSTWIILNEIMEDLMFKLVPLLDNDEDRDIAKAAGRVIGVIYEMYDYGQNADADNGGDFDNEYNENSPYYEQESLLAILTRLLNLSSKKVAKKDKKILVLFSEIFPTQ